MTELPKQGIPWLELEAQMLEAGKKDADWRGGRVPMFVHYAGEDVLEVAKQAYLMYFSENGLGMRAFGSLERFESDVVSMAISLMHGNDIARGTMTTGGTESIFLAVKAARDQARKRRPTFGTPQIVMPCSAHPAFDKAAHFMGLDVIRTPLRADYSADPIAIDAAITRDTVMVVGSVPAFPHGVVDPIGELASVANSHGVWMHVDACVGGYFAPFAKQLGANIPEWDFNVPGVVSISADLHKYGYTAKGASTLLFRDADAFSSTGWYFDKWARGQYFTNTLVGTRSGGAIAAAWAVMHYLGENGYRNIAKRVLATRRQFQDGACKLGLPTIGNPQLSVLAYGSPEHNMSAIGRQMTARGWVMAHITQPHGLHHMLNITHEPVVDAYMSDLAVSIDEARAVKQSEQVAARY
jgi:sphinganine-1-phosphate aldolase